MSDERSRRAERVREAIDFVIAGRRRALATMGATAFLGGLAEALFLITVTRAAFAVTDGDDVVGIVAGRFLSVEQTLVLALGLILARIALAAHAAWRSAQLANEAVARVQHRLTRAFFAAEWSVQQNVRTGSLQELLTTYSGKANALVVALNLGVVAGANLIALIGVAVAVDPLGALVLVVSVGGLGLFLRPLRAGVRRRADAVARSGMDFATNVNEVSDLGLELHVFHVQTSAGDEVGELIERLRDRTYRLQFASGLTTPVYTGLAYLALVSALAVVALSNATSLTSLGAAMLVMLRSLSYGQALQGAYVAATSSVPAIEELRDQTGAFERAQRPAGGVALDRVGTVVVEDVSFAYTPGDDVLRDLSFTVREREIVGIVGPSGSGKSTLVQLLLGLREPDRGRILVGGHDLSQVRREDLARRITFVPQAARLAAGTVAENIRFRRDVDQAKVEHAARLAHLHEDITRWSDGYEHEVGERGGHLSGGQQQRLCIARALVEDPDVLIMDEPTSALDVRSEHLIRTTLLDLRQQMTIIVIAHRLSTLDICDRIMVIQDGQLMGFDAPEELEVSNAFYREALALSGLR